VVGQGGQSFEGGTMNNTYDYIFEIAQGELDSSSLDVRGDVVGGVSPQATSIQKCSTGVPVPEDTIRYLVQEHLATLRRENPNGIKRCCVPSLWHAPEGSGFGKVIVSHEVPFTVHFGRDQQSSSHVLRIGCHTLPFKES
jgi:hypothetical protein